MSRPFPCLVLFLAAAIGAAAAAPAFMTTRAGRFLDGRGRQVLLHGVNVVCKDATRNYLGPETAEDFRELARAGCNCVRLGIIWAGLEPAPGRFDDSYLEGIDQRIAWARQAGLHVFLDMHQDLYSVKFSDGAPLWATLDDGKPHPTGLAVWSDAYFASEAVRASLDHFWANAAAPDGAGLQDHYARAWAHVARRYAKEPAVIGYDLMNEPFPGDAAMEAQTLEAVALAEVMSKAHPDHPVDPATVGALWFTPEGRAAILAEMSDLAKYEAVLKGPQPVYQAFEKERLMPFYTRVAAAIRAQDKRHILFLGTSMAANAGVPAAIAPVQVGGVRDPQQAYAPHGYDLVTDTPDVSAPVNGRVAFIFRRHGETARRLDLPMLVGEWGAYGNAAGAAGPARFVISQFERLGCGETYWAWEPGLQKQPVWQALDRAYPMVLAGTLETYQSDPGQGAFSCAWSETGKAAGETRIYVPAAYRVSRERVKLLPAGAGFRIEPAAPGAAGQCLVVPAGRAKGLRHLELAALPGAVGK